MGVCPNICFWSISIVNPLTPMSDQVRISPYIINTVSRRQTMRIETMSVRGLFLDPVQNSLN